MTTIEEDNINIIEKFKKYYFDNIDEYKLNEEAINGIKLREKFYPELYDGKTLDKTPLDGMTNLFLLVEVFCNHFLQMQF